MTEKMLHLQDKTSALDTVQFEMPNKGPFRTQILGGYDLIESKNGKSSLGETLFETENTIVLGGALFSLEKIFGVQSPLTVDYLNNIMSIANTGAAITDVYPKDTVVCLFGVGVGGSGDTITSVKDVKFYEREIFDMIPFRYTDVTMTTTDAAKYWFKKRMDNGKTAYYLKTFESAPQIKVLWKDAEGDEDGSAVEAGVQNTTRTEPIESFVELILKINKNDCREWFQINGNIEQTRVNSIGLFTGIKSQLADASYDYKQVKMFSKLNINNEMLTLAKDLTIVYRIYTS